MPAMGFLFLFYCLKLWIVTMRIRWREDYLCYRLKVLLVNSHARI